MTTNSAISTAKQGSLRNLNLNCYAPQCRRKKRRNCAESYAQLDELPIRYQNPDLPGKCGQGYLWTGLSPERLVVYQWHANRAAACLDSLLGKEFRGLLQCDGYSAYPAFVKHKEVILFGCWAHTRAARLFQSQRTRTHNRWLDIAPVRLAFTFGKVNCARNKPERKNGRLFRAAHHQMVVARLERVLNKLQPRYRPKS
ncbi:MAG: transposase [Verrucomicrobia bacterium]|nr:transposase [Verrucomicrobiota bacterium]